MYRRPRIPKRAIATLPVDPSAVGQQGANLPPLERADCSGEQKAGEKLRYRLMGLGLFAVAGLGQCQPACTPAPGPAPAAPAPTSAPTGNLRAGSIISIGRIETYGFGGHLGADWLAADDRKICTPGCGYWALRNFQPNGNVDGGGVPVEPAGVTLGRIEFYPDVDYGNWGSNDAWNTGVPGGSARLGP